MPDAMRSIRKMPAGSMLGGTHFVYRLQGIRDTASKTCIVGVKSTASLPSFQPFDNAKAEQDEIESIKAKFDKGS